MPATQKGSIAVIEKGASRREQEEREEGEQAVGPAAGAAVLVSAVFVSAVDAQVVDRRGFGHGGVLSRWAHSGGAVEVRSCA